LCIMISIVYYCHLYYVCLRVLVIMTTIRDRVIICVCCS